jgi:hypothetical protein
MHETRMNPPLLAEAVVAGMVRDRDLQDEIIGDLTEEWTDRATMDGPRIANAWYWRQTLRTTPHLLRLWWRQCRWYALIGAFVAAIAIRLVVSVVGYAGIGLIVIGAQAMGQVPVVTATASMLIVIASAAIVGATLTAIVRRAPMVMIALTALMCLGIGVTLPELTDQAFLSRGMYWLSASVIAAPSLALGALAVLAVRRRQAGLPREHQAQ